MATLARRKISKEQQTQLVQLIIKMLNMRKYTSEIKQAIAQEYGLATRSVERYIARARKEIVQDTNLSVDEHRGEAFHFYRSIINDANSTRRERLQARERIDKLLGLDIHVPIHKNPIHSDFPVKQIQEMSDEDLEKHANRLPKISQSILTDTN